jgi:hypothetical protein
MYLGCCFTLAVLLLNCDGWSEPLLAPLHALLGWDEEWAVMEAAKSVSSIGSSRHLEERI